MISLILPSASQLTLVGQLQVRAKLSAVEYENEKRRESNSDTKRLNLNRNLDMYNDSITHVTRAISLLHDICGAAA